MGDIIAYVQDAVMVFASPGHMAREEGHMTFVEEPWVPIGSLVASMDMVCWVHHGGHDPQWRRSQRKRLQLEKLPWRKSISFQFYFLIIEN